MYRIGTAQRAKVSKEHILQWTTPFWSRRKSSPRTPESLTEEDEGSFALSVTAWQFLSLL